MRIYIITEYYPSTFKPYYDTQFSRFLHDGHDVRIFAVNRQGRVVNEAVLRNRLQERTSYFPERLSRLPRFIAPAARHLTQHPGEALTRLRTTSTVPRWKDRIAHGVRMLLLPWAEPDLCLVHGLTAATFLPWLRTIYPAARVAMYYHGGETPLSSELKPDSVRSAFAGMDLVFTNTRFSADHAVERGCPPDKLRILPVGFSLEDYRPAQPRTYREGGVLRLLSASRLSDEKGHRFALEAIRRLVAEGATDLHYTIVGHGHLRPTLEDYVTRHRLEPYVEFAGLVSTEELIDRIARADVVLLPSTQVGNWVENQACIVQEGMLMKALVIPTATGGVPESTAPELQRFVVPPEDPDAIADAIRSVLALTEQEMSALGEAGRNFAVERYDIRTLNAELLRVSLQERDTSRSSADGGSVPCGCSGVATNAG